MLSPQDAFRVGFLERCVEIGLAPAQIQALAKTAELVLAAPAVKRAGVLGDVGKLAGKAVGGVLSLGIPAALAAPPLLGGTAGYALARATDIDDTDIDDIKGNEVIDEYRRQADRLKRQQLVRRYQQLKRRTGRVFN